MCVCVCVCVCAVCVCECVCVGGEGPNGQTCFGLLLKTSKRAGNEVKTKLIQRLWKKQIHEQIIYYSFILSPFK